MNKIFFITLFTIGCIFVSCSDDDDTKPISLKNIEDTTISLFYPNETKYSITIQGGDGNYSVKSANEEVVKAEMISAIDVSFTVIGLGETKVTITDNSQNSLVLTVIVDYETHKYIVLKYDVRVEGGDLTENEKKAIIEKQLSKMPVKVGGGYKFIFTDMPNAKGKLIYYTDKYEGSKIEEIAFEGKEHDNPNFTGSFKWGYQFVLNNETRFLVFGRYYPTTKSTEKVPAALMEDVTQEVKIEYPKAELVIVSQQVDRVL